MMTHICVGCHRREDATPSAPHVDGSTVYGLCKTCRENLDGGAAVRQEIKRLNEIVPTWPYLHYLEKIWRNRKT